MKPFQEIEIEIDLESNSRTACYNHIFTETGSRYSFTHTHNKTYWIGKIVYTESYPCTVRIYSYRCIGCGTTRSLTSHSYQE